MTKQSVFNPELEKYASDCFNQVAQARLDLERANLTEDVLLYKTYNGVPFVTNGYDYWFLKKSGLRRAGIITLLDYFGATYLKTHMKKEGNASMCQKFQEFDQNFSEDLQEITDVKDIFEFLKNCSGEEGKVTMEEEDLVNDFELVEGLNYDNIETDFLKKNQIRRIITESCRFCGEGDSDDDGGVEHPTQEEIKGFLQDKNSDIMQEMINAKEQFTVFIFNKEIKIETSKIQINDDAIVFNEKIPSVNFASCQFDINDIKDNFTKQQVDLNAFANIPPIPYVIHNEGYHLKIELFNNGFVRNKEMTFTKYYA